METTGETIMAALIGLHPRHFSDLTRSLTADLRLQQRRLSFLLLSPPHFAATLAHLHSLSLPHKALLLARLLLRSLSLLLLLPSSSSSSSSAPRRHSLRLRDFDAALLLLAMCEVYDRDSSRRDSIQYIDWRDRIADQLIDSALSPATLGPHGWGVVGKYVDAAVKCRRLVDAVTGGGAGKVGREVGASAAAVVALPSVECNSSGWECVVCKDDIEVGRDVCEMPCGHVFHWMCILPWLRRRNTCPCCRMELPTDDVFCEIERVWRSALRMCSGGDGDV